jgi:hypothetical protein
MGDSIQPDEPVIVFTVRSLIREMRDDFTQRFDALAAKLDDRVSLGMFRAAQSENEALHRQVGELHAWKERVESAETTKRRISDRALAWAALLVALLGFIATLVWLKVG